ncbi:hypothetical protein PF007_g6859 [Phytophthora fragariae]|uniref:WRKY19-like zinc finger domain-containing protein n=1 Tax=Phytophthora fragariae TaxID=53985 RepID=A0A6A3STY6_9STRA|nr:hypothetical protein PF003_g21994 [Phytophthora fragariae]KAE9123999.1 hypothetical protein PF007_g6859 [Phytophthora fragariae]
MDSRASPISSGNVSLYNIGDILNLPASMDLLDDDDFESTMMMLDNTGSTASSPMSAFRREDPDNLELNLTGLSDAFNPLNTESPLATSAQHSLSAGSGGINSYLSPDLKIRISGRTPVGGDVHIKQENEMPDFSPVMDSFLRESWDDIVGSGTKFARSSFKSTSTCPSPFAISTTPGRVNPLPLNFYIPTPSPFGEGCDKSSQGGGLCRAHGGGKKCRVPGCSKGTQRLGLCYLHGGIRRCIMEGCKKKDRGNGYCISHGGGRRCEAENCNRSVRKGNHCQMHQGLADDTPFQISRGQGLASS